VICVVKFIRYESGRDLADADGAARRVHHAHRAVHKDGRLSVINWRRTVVGRSELTTLVTDCRAVTVQGRSRYTISS